MEELRQLEHLHPSRFLTFTFPNPLPTAAASPYCESLRVAVLDSPIPPGGNPPLQPPNIGAMLVPVGMEDDWIFSTVEGQIQLLLGSSPSSDHLSRLVLVGNTLSSSSSDPFPIYTRPIAADVRQSKEALEKSLIPVLLALSPKSAFVNGLPNVDFLSYEDGIVRRVPVESAVGPVAGEMLVEDVEIESEILGEADVDPSYPPPLIKVAPRELRRRLRFRRMPNLVQSQIRLLPHLVADGNEDALLRHQVETLLVQPYLMPMVASLWLVAPLLEERVRVGSRPRVLCLGVGGGCLPRFLQSQLGFDVVGVEADEVVVDIAKRHFGFTEGDSLRVCVGDGIDMMQNFAGKRPKRPDWQEWVGGIDAIMVDLDSGSADTGFSAPPAEFVQMEVILGARSALHERGILVINVVPSDSSFYQQLIHIFQQVFSDVYELEASNAENYVLVATVSPVALVGSDNCSSSLKKKLKYIAGQEYLDTIRKI